MKREDVSVDTSQRYGRLTLMQDLVAFSRVSREGITLQSTDGNAVLQASLKNLEAAIQESGAVVLPTLPRVRHFN